MVVSWAAHNGHGETRPSSKKVAIGVVLSELSVVVIAMMVICGRPHYLYLLVVLACQMAALAKGIHHSARTSLFTSILIAVASWSVRVSLASTLLQHA